MALEELSSQKCESLLISRLFCFSCKAFQLFSREIDYFQAMGLQLLENFRILWRAFKLLEQWSIIRLNVLIPAS